VVLYILNFDYLAHIVLLFDYIKVVHVSQKS